MPTEFERRFTLPIRSERKLAAATYYLFGVVIPSWPCCPHHSTPWQAFVDGFFARHPITIWKASRGYGGKSFLLSLLGSMLAITEHAEVNILGGSLYQAKRVQEEREKLFAFPAVRREELVLSESARTVLLRKGGKMHTLPASQTSVRSGHPQRLLLDELDEMDIKIFDAAQGQTMDKGELLAGVVGASTQQHPRGTMHTIMRRAKEQGWRVHEWCYRESLKTPDTPYGWLNPEEVERKLSGITEGMRLTEYEGMEPQLEGLVLEIEAVQKMFQPDLGEFAGTERDGFEIEPPVPEGEYVHGADWAKEIDRTVIPTLRIDCDPARVVAWWAGNKEPYTKMAGRLDARVKRYGGKVCHDRTGVGNVVHDLLGGNEAEGFVMSGKPRNDMLIDYLAAVEKGRIVAPRISLAYDEHRYATNDELFGNSHLPDTVCALALAYRAGFGRQRLAWA